MAAGPPAPPLRLVVSGRVQGVGYRAWAVRAATASGLDGWVRNRRDGTVEILLAAGPDAAALEAFVAACRRGPPAARVREVAAGPAAPGDAAPGPGFRERPTV